MLKIEIRKATTYILLQLYFPLRVGVFKLPTLHFSHFHFRCLISTLLNQLIKSVLKTALLMISAAESSVLSKRGRNES